MQILHIIPYGIFITNYIQILNSMKQYSHVFWVWGYNEIAQKERQITYDQSARVILNEKVNEEFASLYECSDMLVVQCLPENREIIETLVLCHKKNEKPLYIVPWGRDANRTSDIYKKDRDVWEPIDNAKKYLLTKCNCVNASKTIYDILEKNYGTHCQTSFFNPLGALISERDELREMNGVSEHINHDEKISVMIGHRGCRTGRHLEIMDFILPYIEEVGTVTCPLAYGEKQWIEEVLERGAFLFSNRWNPVLSWIPKTQYYDFLNKNVDLALMGGDAEGATTTQILVAMGKTVYVKKTSYLKDLLDSAGVKYFLMDSLTENGVKLRMLSDEEKKRNMARMDKFLSLDCFYSNWERVIGIVMGK